MSTDFRQRVVAVAVVLIVTLFAGCKTVGPGMSYNFTSLDALIAANPEEVTEAAKSVVEDMNLILVSAESTGLDGRVIARTARQNKITIDITHQARNVTHVKVQVGRLGDESISMLILDKIKERL